MLLNLRKGTKVNGKDHTLFTELSFEEIGKMPDIIFDGYKLTGFEDIVSIPPMV